MSLHHAATLFTAGALLAACGDGVGSGGEWVIPQCDQVPVLHAPDAWYDGLRTYAPNENPAVVDAARAWARGRDGFQDLWIDRERGGIVSLAFTGDAEAQHRAARAEFPNEGVVVVPVDWTRRQLEDLQEAVTRDLGDRQIASGQSITQGVVTIGFGFLTDDHREAADAAFGGQAVCVSGASPADAPPPGDQPAAGDGWTLLGSGPSGRAWHTALAADPDELAALWQDAGLAGTAPAVDFETHVVVWFGMAVSGSCRDIRLDDVVFDIDGRVVHPDTVVLTDAAGCTSDANPHAFVVAIQRHRLPAAPFTILLQAQPVGSGDEATTVTDEDLR